MANGHRKHRVLLFIAEDWDLVAQRLKLAVAIREAGYDVRVATRVTGAGEAIVDAGLTLEPLRRFKRHLGGPVGEVKALTELARLYRRFRPHIAHHIAMKPMVLGSLAARIGNVPIVINALTGRGELYLQDGARIAAARWTAELLLRVCARSAAISHVIVQNRDDLDLMVRRGVATPPELSLIPGAGVDVDRFTPSPEPPGVPVILTVCRMLETKGIRDLVEAGRILDRWGERFIIRLVGWPDQDNASAISENELRAWASQRWLEYLGRRTDIVRLTRGSHIACLPSYSEGMPKSLLEAAACAKPIVTTDVPGCREVVEEGRNGLLVAMKEPMMLARALQRLVQDRELRHSMGAHGRALAVKRFSDDVVIGATLAVYEQLLGKSALGERRTLSGSKRSRE